MFFFIFFFANTGISLKGKDRFRFDSKLGTSLFKTSPNKCSSKTQRTHPDYDEEDDCDQLLTGPDEEEDPDIYFQSEIDFFKSLVGAKLKDYSEKVL